MEIAVTSESPREQPLEKSLGDNTFCLNAKDLKSLDDLKISVDIKKLYIENNKVIKLKGLENFTQLIGLYAQNNCISKMEGLDTLKNLKVLDLSKNKISSIEGLSELFTLETLSLSLNYIGKNGVKDVINVLQVPTIKTLDLSKNFITDPNTLNEVLVKLPSLTILYLQGNRITVDMKNYRKRMIASIKSLKFLDDSPVSTNDKKYAEIFISKGIEVEREERLKDRQVKENFNEDIENIDTANISKATTKEKGMIDIVPEIKPVAKLAKAHNK